MENDRGRGIESITPTSSPNTSYYKRSKSSRQNEVLTFSRFLSFFFFFFFGDLGLCSAVVGCFSQCL